MNVLRNKLFFISVFFHLGILLLLMVHVKQQIPEIASARPIQAYLYANNSMPMQAKLTSLIKKHDLIVHRENKMVSHAAKKSEYQEKTLTQEKNNQLLMLLHQAIAANQSYPEDAVSLEQDGVVKMGFLVLPNGSLKNIAIVHSSGIESIDMAALTAVRSVSMVSGVAHYLQEPRYFEIDIVFKV